MTYRLWSEDWVHFYRELEIDPYFAGIDTLLHFPQRQNTYVLAQDCLRFQRQWQYQDGKRKLIWEIAPIPLFSFWRVRDVLGEALSSQLETELAAAESMSALQAILYRYYAKAVYGTELPIPHFYVGSNRSGDLKLRAMLPIALLCGGAFRLFYTPYPTIFITREVLESILNDLAFGNRSTSTNLDYSGKLTQEVAQAEYQHVMQLRRNPATTLGLLQDTRHGDDHSGTQGR
jgi:hypothetical protein